MNTTRCFGLGGIIGVLAIVLVAARPAGASDLDGTARQAIDENPEVRDRAVRSLRKAGPEGLAALLTANQALIARHAADAADETNAQAEPDLAWQRLKAAIDAVGGQRDCAASRLFWYTDLDQAKAAAQASGKPILSLRLLGKLTDEFSCANSRFFRTTLYANAEVSPVLRERFVLHWQSVRPVPKVTIDFGDGRKLERTLTGNSIHYVLDAEGRPIDALPGLYGPKAFLRGLMRAHQVASDLAGLSAGDREAALREYHYLRTEAIAAEWSEDLNKVGVELPANITAVATPRSTGDSASGAAADTPSANFAAIRAVGKGRVETPVLQAMSMKPGETLARATDDETWSKIAGLHADDAVLDAGSIALIRRENPNIARAAMEKAMTKAVVESPLLRLVQNFQASIALDTVRNEYLFHRAIHEWFAVDSPATTDVNALNELVYAELFLTPSSDPWLGLNPGDAYTALENAGVVGQ